MVNSTSSHLGNSLEQCCFGECNSHIHFSQLNCRAIVWLCRFCLCIMYLPDTLYSTYRFSPIPFFVYWDQIPNENALSYMPPALVLYYLSPSFLERNEQRHADHRMNFIFSYKTSFSVSAINYIIKMALGTTSVSYITLSLWATFICMIKSTVMVPSSSSSTSSNGDKHRQKAAFGCVQFLSHFGAAFMFEMLNLQQMGLSLATNHLNSSFSDGKQAFLRDPCGMCCTR